MLRRIMAPSIASLHAFLPWGGYSVLYNHEYDEKQTLVDNKKPSINTANQPDNRLHRTYPNKVV